MFVLIQKLNNTSKETACEIRSLFQSSYRIEAQILNVDATNFPPLNRKLLEFINSGTEFYGVVRGNKIAAIVEISSHENITDIESLVVHPDYFRQGLGKQLMKFVLNTFESEVFTIETGLKNKPATNLYEQFGFQEQEQWDTEFGVRKIKFRKTIENKNISIGEHRQN